jgi:hypothetical protein
MRKRFKNITTKKILQNNKVDISSKPSLFYGIDYPHQHKQLVFDYDTIFPLKKVQFEDKEFLAPNNIDKLLTDEFIISTSLFFSFLIKLAGEKFNAL